MYIINILFYKILKFKNRKFKMVKTSFLNYFDKLFQSYPLQLNKRTVAKNLIKSLRLYSSFLSLHYD